MNRIAGQTEMSGLHFVSGLLWDVTQVGVHSNEATKTIYISLLCKIQFAGEGPTAHT